MKLFLDAIVTPMDVFLYGYGWVPVVLVVVLVVIVVAIINRRKKK